jgi:hypothetical protein
VKTGGTIEQPLNPRVPISPEQYDKKFGASGSDIVYSLPSKEARTMDIEVAKEKALAPIKVDTAAKTKKAEVEATLTGQATPEALAAQRATNKVLLEHQTKLNDLQKQREIAVKQANPSPIEIEKINAEIRYHDEMVKIYEATLGVKQETAGSGNFDALLKAATSSGLTIIDPKTKAIVLKPVEMNSAEDLTLQKLAQQSGVQLTKQPATGAFAFAKETWRGKPQIQYGFTAPQIKGTGAKTTTTETVKGRGTEGVEAAKKSVKTPAQIAAENNADAVFSTPEYADWERRFLENNKKATKSDAKIFYKKKKGLK